jgi:hypothetical protein
MPDEATSQSKIRSKTKGKKQVKTRFGSVEKFSDSVQNSVRFGWKHFDILKRALGILFETLVRKPDTLTGIQADPDSLKRTPRNRATACHAWRAKPPRNHTHTNRPTTPTTPTPETAGKPRQPETPAQYLRQGESLPRVAKANI